MILYSQSTNGFYDRSIHGNNVPSDVVSITDEEYTALFDGQATGQMIGSDSNGRPTLFDRPSPSTEQLAEGARTKRNKLLSESDWSQFADAPLSESERTTWRVYRQALRDVPSQETFPSSIVWPEKP